MYRRILQILLIIVVGAFSEVNAQLLNVGISAGMNVATHTDKFKFVDSGLNLQLTPSINEGYQVGVILRRDLNRSLRLQVEPTFIKMGARYSESFLYQGTEYEIESRTKLLYLQLPLLLQLTTTPSERTVFGREFTKNAYHLTGGIFGGYLLDAQFKGSHNGEPDELPLENDFSRDVLIQYSRYDAGVMIGGGYEHDSKVGLETRFQYTLIQSYRGNPRFEPKNLAITFSLVYLL